MVLFFLIRKRNFLVTLFKIMFDKTCKYKRFFVKSCEKRKVLITFARLNF